ncbi:MAG TPA: hypothetical protein VIV14_04700, partial [Gammaproteobacteria bacterium]
SFLGEIKRRKVFQVAAAYLVVAWLIMQVVDVVNEPLSLPGWFDTVAILLLGIGFPIAVILSWAFDLTPEGMVRDQGTSQASGRTLEFVLIGLLVVAMGWVVYRVEFGPTVETTALDTGTPVAADDDADTQLRNSIAVLPFENLSPDPDNAYFAAGIHEELLNQLAKISDLSVISRTSVVRYEDSDLSVPEIADELNVQTVMEGSVRYAGDRVRIAAQLIDAETDEHLWSDIYEHDLVDIFAVQAEIAENIAMALEARLLPSELASIEAAPTSSQEAYELYLRSLSLPSVATNPETLPTHLAYLDQAIALDPDFALAYATKAERLVRGDDLERLLIAQEVAERALEIDPNLGLAYMAIAHLERKQLNGAAARAAYEQAYRLSPNNTEVLIEYSRFLSYVDELDRAIELGRRAIEIEPNASNVLARFVYVLASAGQLDSARDTATEAIRTNPGSGAAYVGHAEMLIALGDDSAALESVIRADQLWPAAPDWGLVNMAYVFGRLDRPDDVERIISRYRQLVGDEFAPMSEAMLVLARRDADTALDLLEQHLANLPNVTDAFDLGALIKIKASSLNDPILGRPEFVAVRERLGFRD